MCRLLHPAETPDLSFVEKAFQRRRLKCFKFLRGPLRRVMKGGMLDAVTQHAVHIYDSSREAVQA